MLRIGPVQLDSPLFLAPIAGHTDLAMRVLCRESGGVGIAYTDLLNSRAILKGAPRTLELAATNGLDQPCGMQLYGTSEDPLPEAAIWAIEHGARVIDINMGCPVDKVAKKHGGSLLLRDCANTMRLAEKLVKTIDRHSAGRVPLTAKMRLGWDPEHRVAPRLARDLESVGVALVTVHGRYTVQFFSGKANWDAIGEVVAAVRSIPIIGNGDVTEPQHVVELMKASGCHGVMIGRAALRTPWLFKQALALLKTGEALPEPSFNDKLRLVLRHLELIERHIGTERAVGEMRQRIAWYGKTFGHVKPLKEAVRTATNTQTVRDTIHEWMRPEYELCPRVERTGYNAELQGFKHDGVWAEGQC